MTDLKNCPELSVEEVADLLTQGRAVIMDANPRRRWSSGHLPGAINIDPGEFTENDLPAAKDGILIFYCGEAGGSASRYAAQKAARMGFVHVFTMPAGLKGWMAAGHRAKAGR
jgi:rhodanese-related sulfurtransferase